MSMERKNPLELPEIIRAVGRCLPLWKHSDNLGFYDFSPKFLLSCTLVSKTWRSSLLPVIWYVYNGYIMRFVPPQIILKYSPYFRLFFGDRSFPGHFESRHIKSLVISWWDQELLCLVEDNAESLEHLTWKGATTAISTSGVRAKRPSPDYRLLMRMAPTLMELSLSHWTLSGHEMVRFLGACKRLHRLELAAIDWVDPVAINEPYSNPGEVASSSNIYNRPPSYQGLTELSLDISTPKEDAFIDLLRYSCPDLERLTLYSESAADPRSLTPILRNHCRSLIGLDYVTRFSSSLDRRDYLSDCEYSDLVLALSDNVRSIKLDIPWLDTQLTRAIVLRPLTLHSLNLRFYERRMTPPPSYYSSTPSSLVSSSYSIQDAQNLGGIILQQCIHLRELSLYFNPHSMGYEETLKLVEKPWACLELESLILADVRIGLTVSSTIWHGSMDESHVFDSSVLPSEHEARYSRAGSTNSFPIMDITPQFLQGPGIRPCHWHLAAAVAAGSRHGESITHLHQQQQQQQQQQQLQHGPTLAKQRLFDQIRRLPRLKRLSLNHVAYSLDRLSASMY